MAESLTFTIEPAHESLWFQTLEKAIERLRKLVYEVDLAVTRERKGRPWVVTELSSSIPTITIRPVVDSAGVVDAIGEGLRVLTGEQEPREAPRYFSEDALNTLRGMRSLFTERYKIARVSCAFDGEQPIATIKRDISEKVERVLRGSYAVLGGLEGTLEAINLRPKPPTFTIWERMAGRAVRCSFDRERFRDQVLSLVRDQSRVLVGGRITYFRNGMPRFISDVTELRDMTPDPNLPPARFGSVPDLTDDQDAVDYLRSIRE